VRISRPIDVLLVAIACWFTPSMSLVGQTNPTVVASIGDSSGAFGGGVAVSSHYLYHSGVSGLRIYDISNPANPADVGFTDVNGEAYAVGVAGKYAYVVYYSRLATLDISNPTNPIVVGQLAGGWDDLNVVGTQVYLVRAVYPFGTDVCDASTPSAPKIVGCLGNDYSSFGRTATFENFAYMADGVVRIYEISDIAHPLQVSSPYCMAVDVTASGGDVFAACWTNGLTIYNVSNPTNPVSVFASNQDSYSAVAASGNYLYLVGQKLTVYDVSNPTNAAIAGSAALPQAFWFDQHGFAVSGGYAYVGYPSGVTIYSLGIPAAPPLGITSIGADTLLLSWPAPSAAFAVQQKQDLRSAKWEPLTNTPVVAGSKNQITIPAPTGPAFYRLIMQ
jgi:hypothetical protein